MGEAFDPRQHVRQLRGRGGAPGDYLDVKWRLVWLRYRDPDATVVTEHVRLDDGFALFRADVTLTTGGRATGYGSETRADFGDFIEKAETKAIGRALNALGFGTAEAMHDDDEKGLADAPVRRDVPALANIRPMPRPVPQQPAARPAPTPIRPAPIVDRQTPRDPEGHPWINERGFVESPPAPDLDAELAERIARDPDPAIRPVRAEVVDPETGEILPASTIDAGRAVWLTNALTRAGMQDAETVLKRVVVYRGWGELGPRGGLPSRNCIPVAAFNQWRRQLEHDPEGLISTLVDESRSAHIPV